ncbi:MAG TPA: HAD hydrolase family protein [Polyangiaceae bacterium]|nr:HAD hydrolase family protein [Polyangiaceae bacterium]
MTTRRKTRRISKPKASAEGAARRAQPRTTVTKEVERGSPSGARRTVPEPPRHGARSRRPLTVTEMAQHGARLRPGIDVIIPGSKQNLRIEHVVFDYNGTLAVDAGLVRGVAARLKQLAKRVRIAVMTADTYGTARSVLADLPVEVHIVHTGMEKRRLVEALGPKVVAAIGNGNNDVPMLKVAALGIVVMGEEGTSVEAIQSATVVTRDINIALDLLLKPDRLGGTLRR